MERTIQNGVRDHCAAEAVTFCMSWESNGLPVIINDHLPRFVKAGLSLVTDQVITFCLFNFSLELQAEKTLLTFYPKLQCSVSMSCYISD